MLPIRAMLAFDPTIDPATLVRSCRDWGIARPALDPGFFQDPRMAAAIEAAGLTPWLNLPVFQRPEYLQTHPDCSAITSLGRRAVADWLHFACPSREEVVDHVVAELRGTLIRIRPAVVSLDFIRHFVAWEQVDLDGPVDQIEDGCYCPVCLSAFERDTGERVDRDHAPNCLRQQSRQQWGSWKCGRIAEVADRLVAEIRALAPEAMLAINTVPWRASDLDGAIRHSAGQDIARLARGADLIAPMAYTSILRRTPVWKAGLLDDAQQVTGKPVLAYVQVEAIGDADPITAAQFEADLTMALTGPYAGVILFDYEHLATSPAKASVLREHLRSSA